MKSCTRSGAGRGEGREARKEERGEEGSLGMAVVEKETRADWVGGREGKAAMAKEEEGRGKVEAGEGCEEGVEKLAERGGLEARREATPNQASSTLRFFQSPPTCLGGSPPALHLES